MGSTTMPTFSPASEGLEGVPVRIFTTIKNMQRAIDSHGRKLESCNASPYLIFRRVTPDDFLKIERARDYREMSRGARITYYTDWNILILKVPIIEHEVSHRAFGSKLFIGAVMMGLENELVNLGATMFKTPRVSKEGDSAYKPSIRSRMADWPTIVLQSGWPESLTRLRRDAHIWLENSGGDIKIVLLFLISRTARTMVIEKWENRLVPTNPLVPVNPPVPANPSAPANRPTTRSMTRAAVQTPTQIQAITIDPNSDTVNGAPLTLEFQKIFLRQAIPPLEHDFTFTAQDLLKFTTHIWAGLQ